MSLRLVQTLKQFRHDGQRWQFVFPKEPKRKGQCQVIRCRRLARVEVQKKKRLYVVQRSVCDTCATRLFRANNPVREIYRQIKDRAERRGQVFAMTLEQLMAVPRFSEYVQRRGRGIEDLHLDRIKVHLGYVPGNVQVLTTEENLRKQREVDYATVEEPF